MSWIPTIDFADTCPGSIKAIPTVKTVVNAMESVCLEIRKY